LGFILRGIAGSYGETDIYNPIVKIETNTREPKSTMYNWITGKPDADMSKRRYFTLDVLPPLTVLAFDPRTNLFVREMEKAIDVWISAHDVVLIKFLGCYYM
jgi:hypothetical protein